MKQKSWKRCFVENIKNARKHWIKTWASFYSTKSIASVEVFFNENSLNKFAFAYFQRRIFCITKLLNHVAPSIEFMTQMWAVLIITALCSKFGTSAFNTVGRWHELDEVENNCTSHKSSFCAICMPKIIKVGGNLTKFWQKQFCTVFGGGHAVFAIGLSVCSLLCLLIRLMFLLLYAANEDKYRSTLESYRTRYANADTCTSERGSGHCKASHSCWAGLSGVDIQGE